MLVSNSEHSDLRPSGLFPLRTRERVRGQGPLGGLVQCILAGSGRRVFSHEARLFYFGDNVRTLIGVEEGPPPKLPTPDVESLTLHRPPGHKRDADSQAGAP